MNKFLTAVLAIAAVAMLSQDVSARTASEWDRVGALVADTSLSRAELDSTLDSLQSASMLNEDVRGESGLQFIYLLLQDQPGHKAIDGAWKRRIDSTNYALLANFEGYIVVVAWQGTGKSFRRHVVMSKSLRTPFRWWFIQLTPRKRDR